MKLRLLLALSLIVLPFVVNGQSKPVRFYSKGKIYVGENSANQTITTLYIDGSTKFSSTGATDADVEKTQIEQRGVTEIKGDFIDDLQAQGTIAGTLFTPTSLTAANAVIVFSGGKADNGTTDVRQEITRTAVASTSNYIHFPTLRVNQQATAAGADLLNVGYVLVANNAAIAVENLEVASTANYKGGFAVDSKYDAANVRRVKSGYALIKAYNKNKGGADASNGYSRLNLKLYDSGNEASYNPTFGSGNYDSKSKFLTAFASPFKELGSDYLLFHPLFKPSGKSLLDGGNAYDLRIIYPGQAYLLSQDVSEATSEAIQQVIDRNPGALYASRFKEGYAFSRDLFKNYLTTVGKPNAGLARAAYNNTREYFNTEDTEVSLVQGLNFVGNPFMAPIDLSPLITNMPGSTVGDFAVYAAGVAGEVENSPVKVEPVTGLVQNSLRAKYWILTSNQITLADTWMGKSFKVKAGSYDAQYVGGVNGPLGLVGNDPNEHLIAPLGVFALQASNDMKIKIKRPDPKHLASKVYSHKSIRTNDRVDELLIQALDVNTGEEDRLSVVFRDMPVGGTNYNYILSRKNFSKSIETDESFALAAGTIFTKSKDGVPILTNPLSKNLKQLAMYIIPPMQEAKTVRLTPYRMETLQSINKIWIEDKLSGEVKELTAEGIEYVIPPVSEAQTIENLKNRFVLYFNELPNGVGEGGIGEGESLLTIHYQSSILYITGLNDKDLNSNVEIFDLQGRLVGKTSIKDVPQTSYPKHLIRGTYIVKITGNRNYTTKFISLQN